MYFRQLNIAHDTASAKLDIMPGVSIYRDIRILSIEPLGAVITLLPVVIEVLVLNPVRVTFLGSSNTFKD